jgi:hypothetical protein
MRIVFFQTIALSSLMYIQMEIRIISAKRVRGACAKLMKIFKILSVETNWTFEKFIVFVRSSHRFEFQTWPCLIKSEFVF